MLTTSKVKTAQELMKDNMLVKHFAGSIAYGTNLPTSDTDYRGIFCADPINVRTPFFPIREAEDTTEEDTKLFELAHFMKLCLDCNPNVVETLWVDSSDITYTTPAYQLLRDHRDQLLSTKIAYSTCGYAMAQLKRIKGHNKWINQPQPKDKPEQWAFVSLVQWFGKDKVLPRDFNLTLYNKGYMLVSFGNNMYGLYDNEKRSAVRPDGSLNTNFDGDRESLEPPKAVIKFNKEEWKLACDKWDQYWKWKANRNAARSELEEEHGYDTKHAMHLVRLLRMGVESLRDGVILVKRPDAEELLDIRNGALTYEELITYSESLEANIQQLRETTSLPKAPNIKLGADLLMEVQNIMWRIPSTT